MITHIKLNNIYVVGSMSVGYFKTRVFRWKFHIFESPGIFRLKGFLFDDSRFPIIG